MAATRIRLYQSALNDVRYVYGAPVRFTTDKKLRAAHGAAKEQALKRDEARHDLRQEAA